MSSMIGSLARVCTSGLLLAVVSHVASAQAATMTFGPTCAGNSALSYGASYSQTNLTLNSPNSGMYSWCAGSGNFAGPGIFLNSGGTFARLTSDDSSPFALLSIDMANVVATASSSGPLTFTGHVFGGRTVSQTFSFATTLGTPVFSTFAFNSSFQHLASVDFAIQSIDFTKYPAYQFTNVRTFFGPLVTTVPEPSSVVLTGVGLLCFAGLARFRRKI